MQWGHGITRSCNMLLAYMCSNGTAITLTNRSCLHFQQGEPAFRICLSVWFCCHHDWTVKQASNLCCLTPFNPTLASASVKGPWKNAVLSMYVCGRGETISVTPSESAPCSLLSLLTRQQSRRSSNEPAHSRVHERSPSPPVRSNNCRPVVNPRQLNVAVVSLKYQKWILTKPFVTIRQKYGGSR